LTKEKDAKKIIKILKQQVRSKYELDFLYRSLKGTKFIDEKREEMG